MDQYEPIASRIKTCIHILLVAIIAFFLGESFECHLVKSDWVSLPLFMYKLKTDTWHYTWHHTYPFLNDLGGKGEGGGVDT